MEKLEIQMRENEKVMKRLKEKDKRKGKMRWWEMK